jgi:Family of unknown function (DUF6174)
MRSAIAGVAWSRGALLAMVGLATACGTAELPEGPAAEFDDDRPATIAATERAFSTWRSQGLEGYRFRWQRTCFCPVELIAPAVVTVRDGVVVAAELEDDGSAVPAEDLGRYETIDDVFAALFDAIRGSAYLIRVRYHPDRGYPETLYVDQDLRIADEEYGLEISGVAPLP